MTPIKINHLQFNAFPRPFWDLASSGAWEPNTFKTFDQYLDKNHSFIDIGAWIGPTTLYGASLAKHVYSFEPDPIAFDELQHNVNLNPDLKEKISLHPICISNKCGPVQLGTQSEFGDSMSSLLFANRPGAIDTKCITLQRFFDVKNITDCNFIKMDIEGGETLVLPHIADFLVENKITLFVSMHPFWFKFPGADINRILEELDKFPCLQDNTGTPITLEKISELLWKRKGVDILVAAV